MGKLILVRHGESEGNAIRHFTTTPDAAITELGRRQAAGAGRRIKVLCNPSLIVSSPYFRARETARIIAEHLQAPIEIEPDLREQSLGHFAGKSYDSVRDDPTFRIDRIWEWRPSGGESHVDVRARTAPVLDRLMATHPDRDIVVVSHGGVMRTLWAHVTGEWEGSHVPPNCGIVIIGHEGGRYRMPLVLDAEVDSSGESGG